MSNIKLDQSNFVNSNNRLKYEQGVFKYFKGGQEQTLAVDKMKSINRPTKKSVNMASTNVFKNIFYMGAFLAFVYKLFGVNAALKPRKQRLVVHFKNGKYFSGYTDIDSFFDIQNAYLDAKNNDEV